ncbi:MAG: hypothetical protein OXL41_01945 [Nitrospinae bacterium]|nr:hypothetical protein [Nitrospinota bacterium]
MPIVLPGREVRRRIYGREPTNTAHGCQDNPGVFAGNGASARICRYRGRCGP